MNAKMVSNFQKAGHKVTVIFHIHESKKKTKNKTKQNNKKKTFNLLILLKLITNWIFY